MACACFWSWGGGGLCGHQAWPLPPSPHSSSLTTFPPYVSYSWQGHAAPILYAVWAEAGFLPEAELLNLRKISSDLDGHPVPVSVPTTSLFQGGAGALPVGVDGEMLKGESSQRQSGWTKHATSLPLWVLWLDTGFVEGIHWEISKGLQGVVIPYPLPRMHPSLFFRV